MLEYRFYQNEIGTPQFEILGELNSLSELGSVTQKHLDKILISLLSVIQGDLKHYDFGYEVYSIECEQITSRVVDTFDGWKTKAEIPTKEVYELMRNWKDYLSKNSDNLRMED